MVQGARHSGAKSPGRGIRDFKHQNPTYLVSLVASTYRRYSTLKTNRELRDFFILQKIFRK